MFVLFVLTLCDDTYRLESQNRISSRSVSNNQNRFLICGGQIKSISISNGERTLIRGKMSIYNAIIDQTENLQIDNLNYKPYHIYSNSIALDKANNKLYLSGSAHNPEREVNNLTHLMSVDMNELTSLRIKDEIDMKYYGHAHLVCIHQVVHLFLRSVDYQNVAHLKWNRNTKHWYEVHEFIDIHGTHQLFDELYI